MTIPFSEPLANVWHICLEGGVHSIQMFCSRVAFAAAFLGTLKLLVETFAAPAALPCGTPVRVGRVRMVTVRIAIHSILVFEAFSIPGLGPVPHPSPV